MNHLDTSDTPPPTPEQVRSVRLAAGQTQAEAAALIYMKERAWRHYENGARAMHPAFFELYRIKSITQQSARELTTGTKGA
jgi:DNA (cytosine-5)-methyltransferase 1